MASNTRRRSKAPQGPLDIDEIARDPGFRGMLSFLEVSPVEKSRMLEKRAEVEAAAAVVPFPAPSVEVPAPVEEVENSKSEPPMGQTPSDQKPEDQPPVVDSPEVPAGSEATEQPVGQSLVVERPMADTPVGYRPMDERYTGESPTGQSAAAASIEVENTYRPTDEKPVGQTPMGFSPAGRFGIPYMDVEGRGKRPLRYCRTVQDAHTSSEQVTYQTLWTFAKNHGQPDVSGARVVDVSLSQLCGLLATDHKHAKRLIQSLQEKLAIEIVRQPDYRLAQPTRYRVYNFTQILERRKSAGLVWVVRTRAVRFVDLATVQTLLADSPAGHSPMGEYTEFDDLPMGEPPELPMGQQPEIPLGDSPAPVLIRNTNSGKGEGNTPSSAPAVVAAAIIREFGFVDDDALQTLVRSCRQAAPDATEEEIAELGAMQAHRISRLRGVHNPVGLLIAQTAKCFAGESFAMYRRDRAEREQRLKDLYDSGE